MEAADADPQRAAEEAKRLRAEFGALLEEKERLRSEVAGLKQDAFEAKRRRLAADAAAQQAAAEAVVKPHDGDKSLPLRSVFGIGG